MKRLLLFLLAVVLAGVSAMAEDWPLKIMGIQVTSDNASSIYKIGDETVFRAEKKEDGSYWIYIRQPNGVDEIVFEGEKDRKFGMISFTSDIDDVYICVENDVVLNDKENNCICVDQSSKPFPSVKRLHLTSNHKFDGLTLNSSPINPVNLNSISELHVSNVFLNSTLLLTGGGDTALIVEDFGYIYMNAIVGFKAITVQGDANTNAASFSDTGDGNSVSARDSKGSVIFGGVTVGKSPLRVNGIDVTLKNADNIKGAGISALDPKTFSHMWFDRENNCLTLENILIESTSPLSTGISYGDEGGTLDIMFLWSSKIDTQYGIESKGNINLDGESAELSIEASTGILCNGRLSIKSKCDIKASGSAINGGETGILDLSGVMGLKAQSDYYVIWNFSDVILPTNWEKYSSNADFSDTGDGCGFAARDEDGNVITGSTVSIDLTCYIRVGDLIVTDANIGEQPFSDPSIEGTVTYDKDTGVLTLEDTTITPSEMVAIRVFDGALTQIVLKGDNNISKQLISAWKSGGDLLITGGGTLTTDVNSIYACGSKTQIENVTINGAAIVVTDEQTLELNNCVLNEVYIYGWGETGTMEITNCTLTNGKRLDNSGIMNIDNSTIYLCNQSTYNGGGVIYNSGTINIRANSYVSAHGLYNGYDGSKSSSLNIDNSILRLKADYNVKGETPTGAFMGYNLTLTDVDLYTDDGETIDEGEDGYFEILRNGERATDWVEIGPKYFRIGDLDVTRHNVDAQPYSDPSIKGTVTYDKETGVLTLDDVTITTESIGLNLFKGKVSQIVLNGENTITSESDMIYNRSALTINGDGTLTGNNVISNDDPYAYLNLDGCNIDCGGFANDGSLNISNSRIVVTGMFSNWSASNVNINSSTLTIEGEVEDGIYNDGTIYIGTNSQVDATGPRYGYYSAETASSLTIDNSTLRLNSGDGILVGKGYNLTCWTDVELETAGGATLYEGKDEYFEVRRGESASDWVVFTVPADKKTYNLSVGGVDVTGLNCSDIKGDNITGKVSYDPVARRLTLTDAAIGEGGVAMGYGLGTTELMLEGSNIITGIDPMSASLSASDPVNITSADGKGSLTINNEEEWGTGLMLGSGGSISNCIIDVTCKHNAINGQATLTITGGYVAAEGGEASVSGFSNLLLGDDTQITSPEGAYYNNEGWPCQLEVGGSVVTEQVVIRYLKNYGIKVGSMWITSDNYMAIKPAELKNGKVSFDPEKSELLLSRARLEEKGIDVMGVFDPLTIVLEGENTIDVAGKPLNLMSKTDIKAKTSILSDSLIIFTDLYGINFQKDLTISDVNLRIDAERAAFLGMGSPKLTLERSSVEATGWDDGVMTDVGDFILGERIKYVSPKDAAFDKETGTLVSGGELLKQTTIKWFMPGDANNDYLVDISDVRAIANNIWEVEDMAFEPYNADLNVDGEVNVTDIVYVVDIILDKPATARGKSVAALARRAAETSADRLILASRNGLLTAALTNAEGYYGLQMDLRLSEGQTLDDIALCGTCADSHVVAWRQTGEDTYRVVVYALSPSALIGGSTQMLTLDIDGEGTVEADDILAVTTDGQRLRLSPATSSVVTGISEATAVGHEATGTYDLNGRKVSEEGGLRKGIYIRNGKKLIVK